jgi:hypothetical protein
METQVKVAEDDNDIHKVSVGKLLVVNMNKRMETQVKLQKMIRICKKYPMVSSM